MIKPSEVSDILRRQLTLSPQFHQFRQKAMTDDHDVVNCCHNIYFYLLFFVIGEDVDSDCLDSSCRHLDYRKFQS